MTPIRILRALRAYRRYRLATAERHLACMEDAAAQHIGNQRQQVERLREQVIRDEMARSTDAVMARINRALTKDLIQQGGAL